MSDAKNSTKPIIVTALVLIVCVGGALWFGTINAPPAITVPTRALPSPNAFDYFLEAGSKMTHLNKIGYAIDDTPRTITSAVDRVYSLAEKEALVRDNAQALARLRQGFAHPFMNPPDRSFYTHGSQFEAWHSASTLLVLEAQTKKGRGDWGGAINSCLDAIHLGQEVPRGGTTGPLTLGIRAQSLGRQEGWKTIKHLSADEARAAARRMEEIISRQVPYADILEETKWAIVAGLSEIMQKPSWYGEFLDPAAMSYDNSAETRMLKLKGFTVSKRKLIRNYTKYMDQLIAQARKPYCTNPIPPPIPNDPIYVRLFAGLDATRFSYVYRCQTQNALFAVTLALRAYRAEHVRYPDTLSALVPSYLTKLPDDPFAAKGPLRYKNLGDKYVLYSVGPDGADDGGIAIINPISKPTDDAILRHMVQPNSRGDIVAGVNQ